MFWEKYGIAKKDLLIPSSILIGALLVSASIFLSSGGSLIARAKSVIAETGDNLAPSGEVKLTERKDAPTEGKGKVEIVEFSDFQCPFCKRFFDETYSQLKSKYIDTGKVKLTFRHYPLPFHQNAQKSAEAAECANNQGKFFPYHDVLFTKGQGDGTGLAIADLKQYASDLGLNTGKFNSCLDNGDTAEIVKKDFEAGGKSGVSGTPTFFINGEKIVGAQPFSAFETAIEKALK
jgi:protein-disulfide isomerase